MSEIGGFRKDKDQYFGGDEDSPLTQHHRKDSRCWVFPGKPGPAVRVGRGKVPQWFQRPGPNGDQFGRHGAAYAAGQL